MGQLNSRVEIKVMINMFCLYIFIYPIVRGIVTIEKLLWFLSHVQREHTKLSKRVYAYQESSLVNYENSISSTIWVPLFPQVLNINFPLDTRLHQHTLVIKNMPNLEHRFFWIKMRVVHQ